MTVRIYKTGAGTDLTSAEISTIATLLGETGRVTLLVPGFTERDRCRRQLAEAGVGLGVDVNCPAAWVSSLWELMGDGRALVDATDRKLLMTGVVAGVDDTELAPLRRNPGTIDMLASMARSYLPYALEGSSSPRLSSAERRVFDILAAYAQRLHESGFIEASEASVTLARSFATSVPACARVVVLRGADRVDACLLALLDAIADQGKILVMAGHDQENMAHMLGAHWDVASECLPGWQAQSRMPQLTAPLVAGPAARDAAYVRLIEEALDAVSSSESDSVSVAVASPDSVGDFEHIGLRLAARGVASCVDQRITFGQTLAGQTLYVLLDVLRRMDAEEPNSWWPAPELVDWLRSPFSGVGARRRQAIMAFDTALRRNRRLTAQDVLKQLSSLQSRELNAEHERAENEGRAPRPVVPADVVETLRQGHIARALRLMYTAGAAMPASVFGDAGGLEIKQCELTGLRSAYELFERARTLGISEVDALEVARSVSVRLSLRRTPTAQDGESPVNPRVVFMHADDLASAPASSYACVLLADMDTATYPTNVRESAKDILAEKFGRADIALGPGERRLVCFSRAIEAAGAKAYLARVENSREGDEQLATPALSVLVTRAKAAGAFVDATKPSGEGELLANLDPSSGEGIRTRHVSCLPEHVLGDEVRPYVLLQHRSVGGQACPRKLSASSIENALACPYRWFLSNRIPCRRFDAGFGPIEMGNFVHDVMQRFHERLIDEGLMRVTSENLAESMEQMDRAFAECREEHARGRYLYGRRAQNKDARKISAPLVAQDHLEKCTIEAILPPLHDVVRYESTMLSIFTPALFEYAFDNADVMYAGRPLGGRIDRIDTAPDAGSGERFVVIDYKNRSVSSGSKYFDAQDPTIEGADVPEGWLPGADKDASPKVQTLIYASAYQRLTGGSAQGAVYFGTRKAGVSGAIAASLAECEPPAFPEDKPAAFPGTAGTKKNPKEGRMEFSELLETVERSIERELDKLSAGAISPRPHKDSCKFCPATMCEMRR